MGDTELTWFGVPFVNRTESLAGLVKGRLFLCATARLCLQTGEGNPPLPERRSPRLWTGPSAPRLRQHPQPTASNLSAQGLSPTGKVGLPPALAWDWRPQPGWPCPCRLRWPHFWEEAGWTSHFVPRAQPKGAWGATEWPAMKLIKLMIRSGVGSADSD